MQCASPILRRPCPPDMDISRATVVRDIQPGAYGQVRLERAGMTVVLAAQSADTAPIPAGAQVEVVDCSRSVVIVRRHPER